MNNSINFAGQWVGYFDYGPEYGDLIGEKVQFRLFIDEFNDGQFIGKSVDLGGIGANYEVAIIRGFIDDGFVSFTKEYPHLYQINDERNVVHDTSKPHPIVAYSGEFNPVTKTFSGEWELRIEIQPVGEYWLENVLTGNWEIREEN